MNPKKLSKAIIIILSLLYIIVPLSSCSHIDTFDAGHYDSFLQEINARGSGVYVYLPQVGVDQIEDMYLYFSDELIDSYYTIYLKCSYNENQYDAEYQRIIKLTEQWSDMIETNSKSFSFDSLLVNSGIEFNEFNVGIIDLSYFLFDKDNHQIIYVLIFEKELNGTMTNYSRYSTE